MKYSDIYDKARGRWSKPIADLEVKDRSSSILSDDLFIHNSDGCGIPLKPGF